MKFLRILPETCASTWCLFFELYLEQRIRQRLDDHRHHFNCIFLRQTVSFDRVRASRRKTPSAYPQTCFVGF